MGLFSWVDENGVSHTAVEVNASQMPTSTGSSVEDEIAALIALTEGLTTIVWLTDSDSLPDAVTAAGATCTMIYLTSGTFPVAADLTIPANVKLRVEKCALITIPNGVTLTINGPLEAGIYQIFSCSGTGKVVFGTDVIQEAYPEWWGNNTAPGTTDMTAAIQAAVTAYPVVKFQSCIYNLTAPIAVGKNILTGVEPGPMTTGASSPTANPGTWFHINHTGRGFVLSTQHDGFLEKFGTFRTQPTPSTSYPVAYTPTAHDYDIYTADMYDITIRDIVLLNPTKGIYCGGTVGGGRINITNIKGQPLQKGIVFEQDWDVCKVDQIHFWPFWGLSNYGSVSTNQNKNIIDYTVANLDSFQFFKCDGPRFTNIFSWGAKSGIRFSKNAYDIGVSVLGQASNLYFDECKYGIWVDNTCSSGITPIWQFSNLVITGINPVAGGAVTIVGSKAIFCEGGCNHQIANVFIENTGLQAIHASVANAVLSINDLKLYNYDQDATNVCAITMADGSLTYLTGRLTIGSSGGTGGRYDTTGIIYVDEWRSFTPAPYSSTGTITSFGTLTGRYRLMANEVSFEVYIEVTDKGTGGGVIVFPLPKFTAADGWWTGSARNGSTGKTCNCFVTNESVAYINYYDNTFPIIANGNWLQATLSYKAT